MPFNSSMWAGSCGYGGMMFCALGVPSVESYVIGGFMVGMTADAGIEGHPHWLVTGHRVNTLVMDILPCGLWLVALSLKLG